MARVLRDRRPGTARDLDDGHSIVIDGRRGRATDPAIPVALGERGAPWWETPGAEEQQARISSTVLALACHRAPDATICPSDVARAIGATSWRALMDPVRNVVRKLVDQDDVVVEQRGRAVPKGRTWKGPIRVRLREE